MRTLYRILMRLAIVIGLLTVVAALGEAVAAHDPHFGTGVYAKRHFDLEAPPA